MIFGEITEARVESAKAMLADRQVSISAVAEFCGFPTINEFDCVFRRVAWREGRKRNFAPERCGRIRDLKSAPI